MTFKHRLLAFFGLVVVFATACGPVFGPRDGELCDPKTDQDRCTDGVAINCGPEACKCDLPNCTCNAPQSRFSRDDCNQDGQRCVVDHDGARCE